VRVFSLNGSRITHIGARRVTEVVRIAKGLNLENNSGNLAMLTGLLARPRCEASILAGPATLAYACPLDRGVRQPSIKPYAPTPAAWRNSPRSWHIESPGRRFNSARALAQPSEGWDARLALGDERINAILGQPSRQSNLSKVSTGFSLQSSELTFDKLTKSTN
jgi:hypothetical protein